MRKVLVTGGNGFIGRHTVQTLKDRGYEPIVLDHHESGWQIGNSEHDVFLGDIRNSEDVTEAAAHADGIIHLGGVLGTQETIGNPRPAAYVNVLGGLNVLEAASQYDLPVVNIAVGNWWMNNTYSISKNTVERFAHMFGKERKLRVANLRTMNAYGPGQSVAEPFGSSKVRKIMPSFICRALTNQAIEIYGNGEQIMDMVYVKDVARDLVDALEDVEANGYMDYTAESGTGRNTTVNDVAKAVWSAVSSICTEPVEPIVRHLPMRPGEVPGSIVKAHNPYGPSYTSLEEGVLDTVKYFQSVRGLTWNA